MVSVHAHMNHIQNRLTDFTRFNVRLGGEDHAARFGGEELAVFGEDSGLVGRAIGVGYLGPTEM